MTLFTRVKWFLAVLGVFLLILATNLADKKYFIRVEKSVDKIYNERLLAKDLLLDVSVKFHKKELAYALNDTAYLRIQNDAVNTDISKLLELFDRAESTRNEEVIIRQLHRNHTRLMELEAKSVSKETLYSSEVAEVFTAINKNIVELAAEQVEEGRNQKILATKAIENANLFSQIEIYFLIFLGIVLQFIVLYNPKKKPD